MTPKEIKQRLEEIYAQKWKDADHCTCLSYAIHELFCEDCYDGVLKDGSLCQYPNPHPL